MSNIGSELHRFGLNPNEEPDAKQWAALCEFIRMLVNNPNLNFGKQNSEIVQPHYVQQYARPERKYTGRFIITFSTTNQRVFVSPGTVAFVEMCGSTDEDVQPIVPTIDDIPLKEFHEDDIPFFDVAGMGLSAGIEYRIRVVMDGADVRMELIDPADEEITANEKEYDTFLIGTILFSSTIDGLVVEEIDQKWKSDIVWPKEESSSSSSSSSSPSISSSSDSSAPSDSSSDSSAASAPSDSGSDKSTAIVPAPWSLHGYTALFTVEAPEVIFEDVITVRVSPSGKTFFPIDSRFLMVCERGSVKIISATADRPAMIGARIVKGEAVFEVVPHDKMPTFLHAKLSGVRRGFRGLRFPNRDREQFEANERTLNAAYPAKDL